MRSEEKATVALAEKPHPNVAVRPSMKERQWQLRENAILDAAVDLMRTKGLSAMTLEDITETIGISRPTLYLHFKSKDDVVTHVCVRCKREAIEAIRAQDPSIPAVQRLIAFFDWSLDTLFGGKSAPFYDLIRVISAQEHQDSRYTDVDDQFTAALEGLIAEGQKEGGVRKDLSATMLAQVLIGLVKNVTLYSLVAEGKTTLQEMQDSMIKLLLPPE